MYSSNLSLSLRSHVPTKTSTMSAAVRRNEGERERRCVCEGEREAAKQGSVRMRDEGKRQGE